ncbi:hypothetical protein AD951_02670 [Acetobacter malorum]|uniref:Uncharacterized protein n=1 Tax=Acetobacter malorum TaxID=178901 RepID=A0A149UR96_9PROT|nr:hypothetical protein [Acetobacter malorum]KXV70529.1 hypothetical protein AD951_02670 [Acetobacter malorum]
MTDDNTMADKPDGAGGSAVDALRASDTWLRTIAEKLDIDPEDTEFVIDAVSPHERRFLARTTLADRLSGNASILKNADAAAGRLPTREEAAQAAAVLLRCNGHDLDVWTGGLWPDDTSSEALAVLAAVRTMGDHDL